jgi:uncharacterized integral membrane protein
MNAKLFFKTIFLMIILLLLVMMGYYNRSSVSFYLPPIVAKPISQPAPIMYIIFFAAGVLTGTILTAGRGGKAGASGSAKSAKPSKS